MLSPRARMLTGFLLANVAIAIVATVLLINRPEPPPQIQGVLLPDARELPAFRLLDQQNQVFTNRDLTGHWSLVTYGFTTCPDICPTTLTQLAVVTRKLKEEGFADLQVLFYTVDHRRDTVTQLASYLPFFDPGFTGLTYQDGGENTHLQFEQGLGIVAQLVPTSVKGSDPVDNAYEVNHGVTLFLINPKGELQAIFEPGSGPAGTHVFDADTVLRDYLAIRRYLG